MSAERYAAIDVGTNTLLLVVAERRDGRFEAVVERADITRLGRGVDRTGRLEADAIRDTVEVLARYAGEARRLGACDIACVATSAARDAANGADFFEASRRVAGIVPQVVSGDEEARLVWTSAWRDFGAPGEWLAVLDVGGGSTEFISGDGPKPHGRSSFQIGAVRLTERAVASDPIGQAGLARLRQAARETLAPVARLASPRPSRLVAVAGTATTLAAVRQALPRYQAEKVHGSVLGLADLEALYRQLGALTVSERARLPGMEPRRADVIVAGCAILAEAMGLAGFDRVTVSDRGLRWGLLYDRFGG